MEHGTNDLRRAIVVVASVGLVASYVVTWDLWKGRTTPPNLSVVGAFSHLPIGFALVSALIFAPIFPRIAVALHTVLLGVAVLGDQIRLQPEFVSLSIVLLAGVLPARNALGRWHVLTLWLWAGIHKALSLGWSFGGASFIAGALDHSGWRPFFVWMVPVTEIALGVIALWPRLWPIVRIAGALFHLGIAVVLYLSHSNTAVWPWNIALVFLVPMLFRRPDEAPPERPIRRWMNPTIATCLMVYPAGFYVGIGDAYLAHNLYSTNTAQASLCTVEQPQSCGPAPFLVYENLNVPMPPERRLFVDWFERTCQPGTLLRIDGVATRLRSGTVEMVPCRRRG